MLMLRIDARNGSAPYKNNYGGRFTQIAPLKSIYYIYAKV